MRTIVVVVARLDGVEGRLGNWVKSRSLSWRNFNQLVESVSMFQLLILAFGAIDVVSSASLLILLICMCL
jgi:hypothetical protein